MKSKHLLLGLAIAAITTAGWAAKPPRDRAQEHAQDVHNKEMHDANNAIEAQEAEIQRGQMLISGESSLPDLVPNVKPPNYPHWTSSMQLAWTEKQNKLLAEQNADLARKIQAVILAARVAATQPSK